MPKRSFRKIFCLVTNLGTGLAGITLALLNSMIKYFTQSMVGVTALGEQAARYAAPIFELRNLLTIYVCNCDKAANS